MVAFAAVLPYLLGAAGGAGLAGLMGGSGEYSDEQQSMLALQEEMAKFMMDRYRQQAALQDQYMPGVMATMQGYLGNQLGQGRNTVASPGFFEPSLNNNRGGLQGLAAQLIGGMGNAPPTAQQAPQSSQQALMDRATTARQESRARPSPIGTPRPQPTSAELALLEELVKASQGLRKVRR